MKEVSVGSVLLMLLLGLTSGRVLADDPIRIAHVYGKTGPLANYGQQSHDGLMLGLEYATEGTMSINGRALEVIEKDSRLDPLLGRSLLEEAYVEDDALVAVGPLSSSVAIPMLPVARQYRRILLVEPAVADTITGSRGNRYVFRTGRSASQEAVANAVALARPGLKIATIAPDNDFGHNTLAAFRQALVGTGAEIVHQEFLPAGSDDFRAANERIYTALADAEGDRLVFVNWAGAGDPLAQLQAMNPAQQGIRLAANGGFLSTLAGYKAYDGLEGANYYYFEHPSNSVNDWLVEQYLARFGTPPDIFVAGGMTAGIALVEALRRADSTDTDDLIETLEGMRFNSPKGDMLIRAEDHQTLQSMYHFRLRTEDGVEWAIPELVREIPLAEIPLPIGR
ncbi:ABC transporter permease [Saccharospirillum sp. MSK14-1]|uniref:substrate-binding domain-containing protein n=1 Tax=Saccharospirillum sp. MSK14-1 TaxID=1897632 RepID=UPI000D3B0577|nr:substrate-binding domain-containing protein [Saccharospirillum sp. MSK14-1]PTY36797.1 ABC transporter permease [Saccharospirillum sp. MSK14-1]